MLVGLKCTFCFIAPQVQLHLTLALEAGYQTGERPVSVDVVESVLSRHIDDLEPTLTRNGYPPFCSHSNLRLGAQTSKINLNAQGYAP
ncbi:hypothetical protein J2X66_004386 [Pseudomonas sp. 3296]|nr:hypothetical protein [Pseudomonas sp. 3296]